jgi:hypothetical protein
MNNVFHPLRDMSLEPSDGNGQYADEFTVIPEHSSSESRHLTKPKQQHIESWLDGSEHRHPAETYDSLTAVTINRLEEQIQMLKVKVEDINTRLENVTSILQETHHPGNVSTSKSSMNFFFSS